MITVKILEDGGNGTISNIGAFNEKLARREVDGTGLSGIVPHHNGLINSIPPPLTKILSNSTGDRKCHFDPFCTV